MPTKYDESPSEPTLEQVDALKQEYEKAGQSHVLHSYDTLDSDQKAHLFQQASNFNPHRINELVQRATQSTESSTDPASGQLEPLPEDATASILDSNPEDLKRWYQEGLRLIGDNKVAVVLMAGGQGTRLGSADPKGCFNIGLPSGKSLFQIQAERISKLQQLATQGSENKAIEVPWYVMTSAPTRKPTEKFFEEHNYFGLDKKNVTIFNQGVLPCISNDGKIILESSSKV